MNPLNIPAEMQICPQWVCWKYEDRGGSKPTKVPYNPKNFTLASSINPDTWGSFQDAAASLGVCDGIGFVLSPSDPYTIVDLDHTIDTEIIAKQVQLCNQLDSYSEISPSGKGLHVIVRANIGRGRRKGPIEVYSNSRFMAMTGNVYLNKPIRDVSFQIDGWLNEIGLANNDATPVVQTDGPELYTDLKIYEIASGAVNGKKFLDLWNGDFHTWHAGDHSRADFALIDMLAFYSKSREQIKRMFLMSGLGRRDKAKRIDYLNTMINRAFDNTAPDLDFTNLKYSVNTASVIAEEKKESKPEQQALTIPPGLVGEIADFIFKQSYKPVPEMSIVGGLGLMAGFSGRAFNISNPGLNLYMLLLAGTGRGKEEIAKGISKITNAVQLMCPSVHDFEGPGDLASGQALLRYLSNHKTGSFVSVFGEFGIRLKSICGSHANQAEIMLQKVLLDLYSKSGATDKVMPTAYSDSEKNTSIVNSPAVTLIGESTPHWFYENMEESMILSGLLPRFSIIEYLGLRPKSNPNGQYHQVPVDLIEKVTTLISVVQGLINAGQRTNVQMDGDAERMSEELDERADDHINSYTEGVSVELWNRVHLKTLRVAALLAVGKNPYQPVIDAECWTWAENFVIHGVEKLKVRFANGVIGSNSESMQVNALIKVLNSYVHNRPNTSKVTDEIYNRKVIPHDYLMSRVRQINHFKNDRSGPTYAGRKIISVLEESGDLTAVPIPQCIALFGSQRKHYLITSDFNYIED